MSDLELTAIGHISGRITIDDSASGNLGLLVFVAGTSYVAMTDDSGEFVISDVQVGNDYSVVISKDGYMVVWDTIDVTTGNITNLNNYNLYSSDFTGSSGDSSYDIWLSLGNEGTEQGFIDSLQGSDGIDDYISINDLLTIGATAESYSVNAWIKIDEYPYSGNNYYYIIGDY